MSAPRYTDPTIYAVAAVLYEDTSLTFGDIGHRLGGLTYNEATGILQNLRNAGALTFERRVAAPHIKRDPVGDEMARLIGQSKEQAELLRHLRRFGWTFEYTGGGHVRCIGPNGKVEIISFRPGEAAKAQFRVHGVTWPEDAQRHKDAPAPEPDGELAATDAAWAAEEQERVEAQIAAAASPRC